MLHPSPSCPSGLAGPWPSHLCLLLLLLTVFQPKAHKQFHPGNDSAEVGSSGWKSTARRAVSGAPQAVLENPEDRVPPTLGRTHNRIRADNLNEVDGALCLLNMEKQMVPEMDMPSPKPKKRKRPESLPLLEQSGNNSEEVGSDVLEGSKPELSLEEVKTIEDFHIMVKGVCIDSELPDDVRMNYYKLCTARKELLHDELAEGLYHKLVAGMIGETVNIANKIKNCQITTTKGEFETWDNHLKSFVIMGMKVKFLRERIATLSKIVLESEANLDVQKYVEAKGEHKRVEDDIQSLTEKLVGLKESSRKSKRIVDGLKEKIEVHEEKLQKQVDAFKIV
ncbi:B3 DNA binding domain-containing protein [Artemisia annua]|uniref:B3 DNA binding domain-containing protein n=1 Tax=Artemisia annua TaxID=35608 RepID=A0A2U1MF74_ARTAN|nr:B3 DNA binding domain-containing protein [Artemisia annua]